MFWRVARYIANGPLAGAAINPVMDSNYTAAINNEYFAYSPNSLFTNQMTNIYTYRGWFAQRRDFILTNQLAAVAAFFVITNNNGISFTTNVTNIVLGRKTLVEVANIRVNNETSNAPVTWNTVTTTSPDFRYWG